MASLGDRVLAQRKPKISPKVFLHCCWSGGIWIVSARRKDGCVLISLTSLKHFLTNERQRAMAIKRGEGQRLIPLEDLTRA